MKAPHLLIRCDASPRIGLGHLMRCRGLAQSLRSFGVRTTFATGTLPSAAERALRPFPRIQVNNGRQMHKWLQSTKADGVLVDHYGISNQDLMALKRAGQVVAVVNDSMERDLSMADWVINQNLMGVEARYRLAPGVKALLGPRYALLREEFTHARKLDRRFTDRDNRILVTFGGGDCDRWITETLNALRSIERPLNVRVIRPSDRNIPARIRDAFRNTGHLLRLLPSQSRPSRHMAWADLAISSTGVTALELMCMGLPIIGYCISDNQRLNADQMKRLRYAAIQAPGDAPGLRKVVEGLLCNPTLRRWISGRNKKVVDGRGAVRASRSLASVLRSAR